MGEPDVFELHLEGSGVYFGGQTVNGQVILETSYDLDNVKSVKVKIKGEGEVEWEETIRRTRTNEEGLEEDFDDVDVYENEEEYVSSKVMLHSGVVPAGYHAFPFSFLLPTNIPCSFEGRYGDVRYVVEAKLDRKGLFSHDRKKKEYITILGMVDLNVMPEVTQPVTESNSKSFGFCCCKSGPLSSTVNLQRTGYAPGEAILVSAEVENLSNKTMNKTEAKLIQTIVFHSRRGTTKESKTTVAEVKKGEMEAGATEYWEAVPLIVPPVPPTGLGGTCSVIEVRYELRFNVDPSGMGFDLVNTIPIMIGTLPLRNIWQSMPAYPPPTVPEGWVAPVIPIEGYSDLPPPTYSTAIGVDEDGYVKNMKKKKDSGEGIEGNWDYHPIYPVWPSAPPPST